MSTIPGSTALTRTPEPAKSAAAALVKPRTACLAAMYAPVPGSPISLVIEPLLMIEPEPFANITGRT